MWCARLRSIRAYACTIAAQSDSSLIERWSFTICESEQPGYFLNLRGSLASVLRRPTNVISRRSPNNCDVDLAATSKVMTDRSFARGGLPARLCSRSPISTGVGGLRFAFGILFLDLARGGLPCHLLHRLFPFPRPVS